MKKAYYARPINLYGTKQEERDLQTIEKIGYESIDINKRELQELYESEGMEVFLREVRKADALFFRAQADGQIGAGVFKEIEIALDADLPVIEMPTSMEKRKATVEETREYLKLVGHR